jgi:TolB-like protein
MWSTKHHLHRLFLFLVAALLLSGCTGIKKMTANLTGGNTARQAEAARPTVPAFGDVLAGSYTAADSLAAHLHSKTGKTGITMLAASFVNINRLEESSPLGRIVSEQISSRMAQNGFQVLEMKLRQHSIYVKEGEGEFLLSRQVQEISASHDSDLLIVGTYAVAEKSIYISARIVNAGDSTIVTGYDYQLERNFQTDSLL